MKAGHIALFLLSLATACGKSTSGADGSSTVTVGPGGGSVVLGSEVMLTVPAGALASSTVLTVEKGGQAPSFAVTPLYTFGPGATTFATPATVQLAVPSGTTSGHIYWTLPGTDSDFAPLPTTISGGIARAQVKHFSGGTFGLLAGDTCGAAGLWQYSCAPDPSPASCPVAGQNPGGTLTLQARLTSSTAASGGSVNVAVLSGPSAGFVAGGTFDPSTCRLIVPITSSQCGQGQNTLSVSNGTIDGTRVGGQTCCQGPRTCTGTVSSAPVDPCGAAGVWEVQCPPDPSPASCPVDGQVPGGTLRIRTLVTSAVALAGGSVAATVMNGPSAGFVAPGTFDPATCKMTVPLNSAQCGAGQNVLTVSNGDITSVRTGGATCCVGPRSCIGTVR